MKIGNMVVPSLGRVENISRESLDIVRVSNVRFDKNTSRQSLQELKNRSFSEREKK
ncbi:hypothetical protein QYZ40_25070 [Vibrio parahaemolyticus]|nr:hypothetical protein [Vibrio parahaemolyticus]MDN4732412.1 hypothetical protein [Vibrio parahaemolyticus]